MKYLLALLFLINTQCVLAGGGINPDAHPVLDTSPNFTGEGIKQIQQNDNAIKRLFKEVHEILKQIDDKYKEIDSLLANKEVRIKKASFCSINKDLNDVRQKQISAKNKNATAEQLQQLNSLEQTYSKSFEEYKQLIANKGLGLSCD